MLLLLGLPSCGTASSGRCRFDALVPSIQRHVARGGAADTALSPQPAKDAELWANCTALYGTYGGPSLVKASCAAGPRPSCDWNLLVELYLLQGSANSSEVLQNCQMVYEAMMQAVCAGGAAVGPVGSGSWDDAQPAGAVGSAGLDNNSARGELGSGSGSWVGVEPSGIQPMALADANLSAGVHNLAISGSGVLATLVRVPIQSNPRGNDTRRRLTRELGSGSSSGSWAGPEPSSIQPAMRASAVPVARSYNGFEWEGSMPSPLSFACKAGGCTTMLPAATGSYTWELRVYNVTRFVTPNAEKVAARFLTQATFGPKRSEIRDIAVPWSIEETERRIGEWLHTQMYDVEPSLHRIYLRRRFNPTVSMDANPSVTMRPPCKENSSWVDIAFSRGDRGKFVDVNRTTDGLYTLSINGVVRSVVTNVTDIRGNKDHNCYKKGFRTPLDSMPGYASTNESNTDACHTRCERTNGCVYFSFLPLEDEKSSGKCYIQSSATSSTVHGGGGVWRTGRVDCVPYEYPASDIPGLRNMGVGCWGQCGAHGACPQFCGANGYCCRYTRDLNGCVTTDPTKTSHRCIPDPAMPPPPPPPAPFLEDGRSYVLCYANEYEGGDLVLLKPGVPLHSGGGSWKDSACGAPPGDQIVLRNPMVVLPAPDVSITQQIAGVVMERITVGGEKNRFVARNISANCILPEIPIVFVQDSSGKHYRHEARMELLVNTVERPNIERRIQFQRDKMYIPSVTPTFCPAASPSFTNRRGCVRKNACADPEYSSGTVRLNDNIMRQLFKRSNKFVYYISGLRFDSASASSVTPCSVTSRWAKSAGPCQTDTALDNATKTILSVALQQNIQLDTAFVREISPPALTQANVPTTGWTGCANEGGNCLCGGMVRYGVTGMWSAVQAVSSSISCTNSAFGGDPAPNMAKQCQCNTASMPSCTTQLNGVSVVGAQLTVNGTCFRHVHREEFNVYEFGYWTTRHPGNTNEAAAGRPNPIMNPARTRNTQISFPSWHGMDRWPPKYSAANPTHLLRRLGVYGEDVQFSSLPTTVQVKWLQDLANVTDLSNNDYLLVGSRGGIQTEACGSPGEVENFVELGHKYGGRYVWAQKPTYDPVSMLWPNAVWHADDQLRQRVAWALSQTYVLSNIGFASDSEEPVAAYHDIFVRNAFGNFGEMLKEVSYSYPMGRMLTYVDSKSAASSGNFADENFARESIQLFTVGLYHLNNDGTPVLDSAGNPRATYDVKDVASFARAWTGFVRDTGNLRSNAAATNQGGRSELYDPMTIRAVHRDASPKMDLLDGFIGDGLPACKDLPSRAFLRKDAVYHFLGGRLSETHPDAVAGEPPVVSLSVRDRASVLYRYLCGSPVGQACDFQDEVILPETTLCHGDECKLDRANFVEVVDALGRNGYYEFVPQSCTNFLFFNGGKTVKYGAPWHNDMSCSDSSAIAASPMCCPYGSGTQALTGTGAGKCEYSQERVTYQTAVDRCAAIGQEVCFANAWVSQGKCHPYSMWRFSAWLDRPCSTKVQIQRDGRVSVVHDGALYDNSNIQSFKTVTPETYADVISVGSKSIFDVLWDHKQFPKAISNCSGLCTLHGESCVCDVDIDDSAVFTDNAAVPTRGEILERLHIGAADPESFDHGVYARCTTSGCNSSTDVVVWNKTHIKRVNVNVALGKPVQVSSRLGPGSGAIAVDGAIGPIWHSQCSGEQWLQVDLQNLTQIVAIKLHHRTDCCGSRINGAVILISDTTNHTAGVQCGGALSWVNGFSELSCGDHGLVGRYVTVVQTGQCLQISELEVFSAVVMTPNSSSLNSSAYAADTIFEVNGLHGLEFYVNRKSQVSVGAFTFRNPPTLINYEHPTFREAETETDLVLDHLVTHPSTAPFVCKKLIQRLTSSNPSPRYVQEVVTAFRSGAYKGRQYSGRYGDLGAATAAIFLDREARDSTLDADPSHGKLREPLLKVLHLLRSLEFEPRNGVEFELSFMENKIGMFAFRSPSIFNFYLPDHIPAGPASKASLYAPEAEILSAPFVIGYMNGVASLVDNGLTSCDSGFGVGMGISYNPHMRIGTNCHDRDTKRLSNEGDLTYMGERGKSLLHDPNNDIVVELSLLLTGGYTPPAVSNLFAAAQRDQPKEVYVVGPMNVVNKSGCISSSNDWHGTLDEAQERCNWDANCDWLYLPPNANGTNFAFGKPVQVSSTFGASLGAIAVDGAIGPSWHSHRDGEQWLQVDLQNLTQIVAIKLHHRTDCCGSRINGAVILISDTTNHTAGVQCGGALSWVNGFSELSCGDHGLVGRYVTVVQTGQFLQISELEVFGPVQDWRTCGSTTGMIEPAYDRQNPVLLPVAQTLLRKRTDISELLPSLIKLFAFSSEFHSTNMNLLETQPRLALPEIPTQRRPYKAIVIPMHLK
jgi:uncharacterized protein (DUF1800 family)